MTIDPRGRGWINIPILLLSTTTWVMLLVNPSNIMTVAHCSIPDSGTRLVSFQMQLGMSQISSMASGWFIMLIAMMSPTLIAPIRHILERSFKRRRARSVTLFVVSYVAIWMVAGGILLAVTLVLRLFMPQSFLPLFCVGLIVFVWQCSPIKQRCLNRSHNHSELAAFGFRADVDVLHFGVKHGIWCVGSCWALMLLPMLLSHGHFAAMAIVTFIMISERLEKPKSLGWRLCFPGKLISIVVAQTRVRLQSLPSGVTSSHPAQF